MKKALYEVKGTVAYSLVKHMNEINEAMVKNSNNLTKLKETIKNIIISDPEITDTKSLNECVERLSEKKSPSAMLSTITTYITGEKVA